MSLDRAPALPSEMVRGNVSYMPFWPGGFPDPVTKLDKANENLSKNGNNLR